MVESYSQTETYDYGITRTYIDGGRIVLVETKGDMSRNAINTWASLLVLTMQEADAEYPLGILHDFTHPNQGLTPFTRERAADVINARPEGLEVYSAVLLPNTFIKRIIEMFLRTPIFQHKGECIKIFSDETEALDWLREKTY